MHVFMVERVDGLGQWQLDHYQSVELIRLKRLIDTYADKAGSIVELIDQAASRFKQLGFKPLSSNDISGLQRDKTKNVPIKASALSDRSIYKLAILLDVDDDIIWGSLILRLYLSGKIDNIETPIINAIKNTCELNPDIDINLDVLRWVAAATTRELRDVTISAVKRLAGPSTDETEPSKKGTLLKYIQAVVEQEGLTLEDVPAHTALSSESLRQLASSSTMHDYELASLAAWLETITGETVTPDALAGVYEITVSKQIVR